MLLATLRAAQGEWRRERAITAHEPPRSIARLFAIWLGGTVSRSGSFEALFNRALQDDNKRLWPMTRDDL